MGGAQAGAVDNYYMNELEAELTVTLWKKDGFCEFGSPLWPCCLWLHHAVVPPD